MKKHQITAQDVSGVRAQIRYKEAGTVLSHVTAMMVIYKNPFIPYCSFKSNIRKRVIGKLLGEFLDLCQTNLYIEMDYEIIKVDWIWSEVLSSTTL